jgi:hypothetical protein
MPGVAELQIPFAERKLLRWLFAFYFLFILYGSFIPFRFSDDRELVRSQFVRFFTPPYDHGVGRFSLPDVVSNVLFFIPFGFLWLGSWRGSRAAIGYLALRNLPTGTARNPNTASSHGILR